MQTDWLIVRRLAAELRSAIRGRRIRAVGLGRDDRLVLRLEGTTIAIDALGPAPIVTLEDVAILERERWWVKTTARALEGLRVDDVRGRHGDRLIAFECSARSRFGVATGYRLVAELVPRFGNIVLLKDDTIVTAAREFARGRNAARATIVGEPYEPPPLPSFDGALGDFANALAAPSRNDALQRASRALRSDEPLLPPLIAESFACEARDLALAGAAPLALVERTLARARALIAATNDPSDGLGDVFVYRDGTNIVAAHVVPLAQYASYAVERVPAMLPVVAEAFGTRAGARHHAAHAQRRAALAARVSKRRTALDRERASGIRERDDVEGRGALRRAGDLLYAHLSEVPARAERFTPASDPDITIVLDPELNAKGNAAAIFKRYRKATAKLTHIERRLGEVDREIETLDSIAWEIDRADAETLLDVAEALERIERGPKRARRAVERRRPPLDVPLAEDARLYVGRSPQGNAELTFRIARPDDLWFHARATPGAHVVLHLDTPRAPAPAEVERAAQVAAFHSKARDSEKVAVDYTERKHVRRQRNAAPGLVWYVNARTLVVTPRPPDAEAIVP